MAYEIEGPWEDILQHGAEFSGKRVRITVLPETMRTETPLPALLEGLTGVIDSSQPSAVFPHKETAYGDLILEKFRKQGLRLP